MFLKVNLKAAVFASVRHRIAISCLEKLKFEPGRVFFHGKVVNLFSLLFSHKCFQLVLPVVFTLGGWGRRWSGLDRPFSSGRSGRLLSTRLCDCYYMIMLYRLSIGLPVKRILVFAFELVSDILIFVYDILILDIRIWYFDIYSLQSWARRLVGQAGRVWGPSGKRGSARSW